MDVAAARLARPEARAGDHPRGDGPHRRAGDADAGAAPGGDLEALGPLRHRRRSSSSRTASDRDLVLAITHEEIVALHASQTIRSYRDLPQIWYHIQLKERDEPRSDRRRPAHPRVHDEGLLHARPRPGRPRRGLRPARGGLRPHLHPLRARRSRRSSPTPGSWAGAWPTSTWRPRARARIEVARCSRLRLRRERRDGRLAASPRRRSRRARRSPRSRRRTSRRSTSSRSSSGSTRARPARRCRSSPRTARSVLALVRGDRRLHELKLRKALRQDHRSRRRPRRSRRPSARSRARSGRSASSRGRSAAIIADETLREGCVRRGRQPHRLAPHRASWLGRDYEAQFADLHEVEAGRRLPALRRRAARSSR